MSKSTHKPDGSTHFESDGTFWKNEKGMWYWWNQGWGWCQYVGMANANFHNKLTEIGG